MQTRQRYDWHLHSTYSDGELTPAELAQAAVDMELRGIALTDHDTLAGAAAMAQACAAAGLDFITGVEVSSRHGQQDVHIVGLNVDPDAATLGALLAGQAELRETRARMMCERLQRVAGADLFEQAQLLAGGRVPARPHIAAALVQRQICTASKQAFSRYLAVGKPGYVATAWPNPEAVVAAIRQAGGLAVLAHPGRYRLTRTKLRQLVRHFADVGGQALEAAAGSHSPDEVALMVRWCEEFALYASRGSDYHGPSKPWARLGYMPMLPAQSCTPIEVPLGLVS